MHWGGEWVYRVLYPPSEEEGVTGAVCIDESYRESLYLNDHIVKDGSFSVSLIGSIDDTWGSVRLDADGIAA